MEKKDADGTQQNSWSPPRDGCTGPKLPSLFYTKSMSRRENEPSTPWQLLLQTPHKADRFIPGSPGTWPCHAALIPPPRDTNTTQRTLHSHITAPAYRIIPCQQVGGTSKALFSVLHFYTAFISPLLSEFPLIIARRVVPKSDQWRHRDPHSSIYGTDTARGMCGWSGLNGF